MKKILEYKVLEYRYSTDLQEDVNGWIKEGWQPYGNLVFDENFYTQIMVRYGK